MAGIGVFLGTLGSDMLGKQTQTLNIIQRAIDNDFRDRKARFAKNTKLLNSKKISLSARQKIEANQMKLLQDIGFGKGYLVAAAMAEKMGKTSANPMIYEKVDDIVFSLKQKAREQKQDLIKNFFKEETLRAYADSPVPDRTISETITEQKPASLDKAKIKEKQEKFTREGKIRADYNKMSKFTNLSMAGYVKMKQAFRDFSGASDLAFIFSFMKSIDPDSAVKEGEFNNAANTVPASRKVVQMRDRFFEGTLLTRTDKIKMLREGAKATLGMLRLNVKNDEWARNAAKTYGLDPSMIINPNFQIYLDELEAGYGVDIKAIDKDSTMEEIKKGLIEQKRRKEKLDRAGKGESEMRGK